MTVRSAPLTPGGVRELPAYRREVLGEIAWPSIGGIAPAWPKVTKSKKPRAKAAA